MITTSYLSELKKLDLGVPLAIRGEVQTVKGVVVDYAGNNLGRHQVFEYLQSFRANHFCEWCMTDQDQMQINFHESEFAMHTEQSLARDVLAAEENQSSSPESGMKRSTILNSL